MSKESADLPSSGPEPGAGQFSHAPGRAQGPADLRQDALVDARQDDLVDARQDDLAEPSWGLVLGTTARLWLERRILRHIPRRTASVTMRRRLTSVIILVAVVFAAGALTVALTNGAGTSSAAGDDPPGDASLAATSLARQQAAQWITAQVSHSATVACDPVMCSALQSDNFPSGNLIALSPAAGDPLGAAIVVSTEAIRSQFGNRLNTVYAPVTIASFGTGTARVDVRVTAADGSRAYLAALRADLLARQASGVELLGNQHLVASAVARQPLADGDVDSRLLSTLAVLAGAAHLSVEVLKFGDIGPGASAGVPMRDAVIAIRVDGKQPGSARYLQSALSFLRAQEAPFRAASMTLAREAGQPVLLIQFDAPSPLGLLGAGSP
jgi:hypothetical protein